MRKVSFSFERNVAKTDFIKDLYCLIKLKKITLVGKVWALFTILKAKLELKP